MNFLVMFLVGAAILYFVFRPKFAAQTAADKVVNQQHLLATDELIAGILAHATNVGQLHQARGLFDKARQRQGDGTVRVGHVAWVLMKLNGDTDEAPPTY